MIDAVKLESIVNNEGNVANFAQMMQEFVKIGIVSYDYLVADGLYRYYDAAGDIVDLQLNGIPHPIMPESKAELIEEAVRSAQAGKLANFDAFCQRASLAGVIYWRSDLVKKVVNYYGWEDELLLSEPIPGL
ncbi:MAG: DUF1398 domain-containing protein [Streptococcaceae bacterium]|jgi:uncharacterized protein YbcV (DUF1398 family)|nr:DUF1398 domain-containing protein [Streptococcaceae bacterium]